MKDCSNSIATTPELLQSNAKPSIYPVIKILYTLIDVNPYIPMITGKIRVLLCLVVVGSELFDFTATHQGPYSKSREISKSRDRMLWWSHCFETWVASWQLLLRCPSNVRAIAEVCSKSRRLRDFTISCGKTSIHLVNRGPVGIHQWLCHIYAGPHWFRLVAYSAPSHYLNQCWVIANWTPRNKLQWNTNQNTKRFIHENASENIFSVKWRRFC